MKSDEAVSESAYQASFEDFTEESYSRALVLAKRTYEFGTFTHRPESKHVLWRHDVDCSVHRALRLAEIEAGAGIHSTYFMFLHSPFYNLLSDLVAPKAMRVLELGHDLGLHFDPSFYGASLDHADLLRHMEAERLVLTEVLGRPPVAVSFHNMTSRPPADDLLCGMVNAYGETIWSTYGYCSDSNGVWRHRRLFDVLERAEEDRLQVLTHPEWWTPTAMSPRARIQRCLDGQAAAIGAFYDDGLRGFGRPNIR